MNVTALKGDLANELAVAALDYAKRGWAVFPLHTIVDGRCTCGKADCSSSGKHPRTSNGVSDATTEVDQIKEWWATWPDSNIGIAAGESGLDFIDIDPKNGGNVNNLPLVADDLETITALTGLTESGERGKHCYFRHPKGIDIKQSSDKLPPGIDIRTGKGYVVAPPSLHYSGVCYEWVEGKSPDDVKPLPLPAALMPLLKTKDDDPPPGSLNPSTAAPHVDSEHPYVKAALGNELDELARAAGGARNNTLNKAAFNLGQFIEAGLLDRIQVESLLFHTAAAIGLSETESHKTIKSGIDSGIARPRTGWPEITTAPKSANGSDPAPVIEDQDPPPADSDTLESLLEAAQKAPDKDRPQALNDLIEALATVDMITVDAYADRVKEIGLMRGKGLFTNEVKARKKAIDQERQDQIVTKDDPLLQAIKNASVKDRPKAIDDLVNSLAFADPVTIETYAQQVKALGFRTTKFDEAIAAKRKALRQERLEKENDDNDPWPYEVKQGQITYNKHGQDGQLESFPVAAFVAQITSEITSEHGGKWYGIEGKTYLGQPFSLEVCNDDFASNSKLTAALTGAAGAKAPVMARMEPHLRPAIQKLTNGTLRQITRYDRTGWTGDKFLIPGRLPEDVNVLLPPKLPYGISSTADLQKGLKALDALLAAMPQEQSTVAAVLAFQPALARLAGWLNERYALFITGRTGNYKSSWSQVLMAIWGDGFLNDSQLIKWGEGATRNAIMALAAGAHDLPLLIDNYKPNTGGGARAFVNLVHNIVEGGEKDRLNRNAELRETRPVFCWPIFTGEDVPDTDPASLARILVVKFAWERGKANDKLTEAQSLAPHLSAVGNAWLDWLESESGEQAAKEAQAGFAEARNAWANSLKVHQKDAVNVMRVATNLATNELTYNMLLKHPDLKGIFKPLEAQHLEGLNAIANSMADSTAASLEAHRFLEALGALYHSERVTLAPKTDTIIDKPERHIGWKDDEGCYLIPDLAIAAVLELTGRNYLNDISKQSLYAQLDELGYVKTKDERHGKTTIQKWLGGKNNRVLHLNLEALEQKPDDTTQEVQAQ